MTPPAAAPAPGPAGRSGHRLTGIDSLRGLAALAVVGFHFTTRYDEVYGFSGPLPVHVPWGYLGVNLFFVISGFVIFMTLERTSAPMDFVVSRASRLYPAYWTAVALTFCITSLLGLPGREVSFGVALLNLPMFSQLFRIPLVDGVYWTLLVELLFYLLAFGLFLTRSLHRVLLALAALFALRLVYWGFAEFAHVDLPWRIGQLLVLDYIPFFGLGIVAYRLTKAKAARPAELAVAAAAVAVLAIADSVLLALVGAGCFCAVWAAAAGKLRALRHPLLVWFGTISYPLYLLHENVGWSLLRRFQQHGLDPVASIALATPLVIALAAIVSAAVEYPAMDWIRKTYRQHGKRRERVTT